MFYQFYPIRYLTGYSHALFIPPSSGSFSLLSPKHLESTHPYYPTKSQAMTAHSGTPVPPRYLMRGHQHLSPSVFATDQGIQVSLSQHYNGGAPGSGAVHIQQSLLPSANHGNPNVTNLNSCSTQYHQGYYSPGECDIS